MLIKLDIKTIIKVPKCISYTLFLSTHFYMTQSLKTICLQNTNLYLEEQVWHHTNVQKKGPKKGL